MAGSKKSVSETPKRKEASSKVSSVVENWRKTGRSKNVNSTNALLESLIEKSGL